jgi:hypothetical protein
VRNPVDARREHLPRCSKCAGRHSRATRYCGLCLTYARAYNLRRRQALKAAGLCHECKAPCAAGRTRCPACLAYRREQSRRLREAAP